MKALNEPRIQYSSIFEFRNTELVILLFISFAMALVRPKIH